MELLTLAQVGQVVKKSTRGLRKDIVSGRFGPDVLRLGRCVRVRADELGGWIDQGCPSRERWVALRDGGRKALAR